MKYFTIGLYVVMIVLAINQFYYKSELKQLTIQESLDKQEISTLKNHVNELGKFDESLKVGFTDLDYQMEVLTQTIKEIKWPQKS